MDERQWFVGSDWASEFHQVHVMDVTGAKRGTRRFPHSGAGLAALADWLLEATGTPPGAIHVAIETPHGPVVETLMGRGFRLHAINPKQLDRFRGRLAPRTTAWTPRCLLARCALIGIACGRCSRSMRW